MKAPNLNHRYSFQKRVTQGNDGRGNDLTDWVPQFEAWASRVWLRGGEAVLAARLSGVQTAVITVRSAPETKQIDSFWRCVDLETNQTYNIKQPEPHESRHYIDLPVQSGGADG